MSLSKSLECAFFFLYKLLLYLSELKTCPLTHEWQCAPCFILLFILMILEDGNSTARKDLRFTHVYIIWPCLVHPENQIPSFFQKLKTFQDSLSRQILRHMHRALNIDKK